jgi:hypothetical protein
MAMIGVTIPCQHQFNDETLCEANRDAIVEATAGEPMTRDYPGSADYWECITISECPNGCICFSKEFQHMEEWAVAAAQELVQGEPPVLGE